MLDQARPEAVLKRWLAALLVALSAVAPLASAASAQELSDRASDRCTRAAVRIQVDVPGGSSSGSGSIIDSRGYVLTNFHVLGVVNHGERSGAPGTFYGDGEHVQIATVTSARDTATTRYIGRIVRGDVRLDLALVRIISNADGTPLAAGTTFPTVELATTQALQPGANLWAFGFPMGVRTINVTGGHMTGFQMSTSAATSSESLVSWIRTDAEFNPGNSGGMLVDRRGRLVAVPTAVFRSRDTLEPIELARPVERIPSEWTSTLARATDVADQVITGMPELIAGQEIVDHAMGDSGSLDAPEIFYYRVPSDRPGTITVTPALRMALIAPQGDTREGQGSVMLFPQDPAPLYLAVLIERPTDGTAVELHVRFEQTTAPPTPQAGPYGPYPQPGPYQPYPGPRTPYPPTYGGAYPQPRTPYPPAPSGPPVAVHGRLIDAASGAAIVGGMVMLARPGVDLRSSIALLAAGRMTQAELDAQILARAQTDATGQYTLTGIPRGRYSGAGMASGFTPAMITLTIGPADPAVIEALPIQIGR
jgi:S1-C subfamily serine protease